MALTHQPKAEVLSPRNAVALDTLAGVRSDRPLTASEFSITYCHDTFKVTTVDGKTRAHSCSATPASRQKQQRGRSG